MPIVRSCLAASAVHERHEETEYSRYRLAFDSAKMRHLLAADPRVRWLGRRGTLNNRRHLESSAKLGVRPRTTMRPRAVFSVDSESLERRSDAMPHLRVIRDQGDILDVTSTFRRAAPPSLEGSVWPPGGLNDERTLHASRLRRSMSLTRLTNGARQPQRHGAT